MIYDWLSNNWIEIFGAVTGIIYVFLEIRQKLWLWPVGIVTSAVYIWVFFTGKLYADMSLQGYYLAISCVGWYWWIKGTGRRAQGAGRTGHRAQGAGHRAQGAGHRAQGAGRRAQGAGHRAQGAGHRAQGAGHRAQGEERRGEWERGGRRDEETKGVRDEGTQGLKVTRLKFRTGITLAGIFVVIYAFIWLFLTRLTDSPVPVWDSFITSLSIIATWMLARKIFEHWYLWVIVNGVSIALFIIKGLYPTVILYIIYFIMSFEGLRQWKRSL